ncbi:MAG: hypothetical protein L7S57_04605 [Luminiphilus sp.]|nr:hypothetical protein [Luminiphilus sp.]
MSYLLDIFNKRQPAPEVSAPQQMQRPMAMPSGGPNMPQPDPTADAALLGTSHNPSQQWNRPMTMPSGGPNTGTPMPTGLDGLVGISGQLPPMDVATAIACGIPPSQINRGPGGNAQNNPMPQMPMPTMGGMWSGITPTAPGMGGVSQMPANPGMGGVGQMPAFQPPQPMPFNNRPMPQWGAPNFSMQNGTIGAPQPSPMNGMMKGMFGVR